MKKIIYSLVIMIAVGSLFTSCIENVEPVGIQELRLAKADYLNALAELRAADAELQLANAAYRLAETRWMNAKADQEEINTKINELYYQRDRAYTQYYIDSINLEIKNMEERQAADLARAKQERAEAEENLRVALAKIEAAAMRLTTDEAKLITDVIDAYKLKLEAYNTAAENVTIAKTALWNVNYSYVDSVDWLAIYTNAQARAISRYNWWVSYYQQFIDAKLNDKAAWDAELQQLQDSMDAANYSRNEITKDSVYYMINVFCEANKAYKAKVEAYVDANIESPGTKPTRGYAVLQNAKYAYTANVAVVSRFNAYVDNMLFNGSVKKYASQEGKLWNRNKGAVNADSILLKTKVAAEKDTLVIFAQYADKGIIMDGKESKVRNNVTADTTSYKPTIAGLNKIIETLERDLVTTDVDYHVADLEEAAADAKKAYEDTRVIIEGGYTPVETATKAAQAALKAAVNTFIANVTDYQLGLSGANRASVADSAALYNAIIAFETAKATYMGVPTGFGDTLMYKNTVGTDMKTSVGELVLAGFKQNRVSGTSADPTSTFRAVYGGNTPYTVDALGGEYNQWNLPASQDNDAVVRAIRAILHNATWTRTTPITAASLMNAGTTMPAGWSYDAATGAITGTDFVPIPEIEFRTAACEFWGFTYSAANWAIVKNWDLNFSDKTFTTPTQAVLFENYNTSTATGVLYSDELGIILENIEGMPAGTYASLDDYGVIDDYCRFTINYYTYPAKKISMLFDWFYKQQRAEFYGNYESNKAILAELRAMIEKIAADFDAADAKVQTKYDEALAKWTEKNTAYEAAMTELTGKKNGVIVYDLSTSAAQANGSYKLKGLQLTWANELAPGYPAKVQEWKDSTEDIDHLIYHLTTLKKAMNDAYLKAANISWNIDPAITTDYQEAYEMVCNQYALQIALFADRVAKATRALEQYKAGYDGKALAIQVAENDLAEAEAKLAIAEKELELAKAEMDAVIAKYIG